MDEGQRPIVIASILGFIAGLFVAILFIVFSGVLDPEGAHNAKVKRLYEKGIELQEKGKYDDSLKKLLNAYEKAPENQYISYAIAFSYSKVGEDNKAVEFYRRTIHLDPAMSDAYYGLGNLLFSKKLYDEAIDEYKKVIEMMPLDAKVYGNLGLAYYYKNNYQDAIQSLLKAIKIDPLNPKIHNDLGITYFKNQEFDLAIKEYKQALKLNPQFAEVYDNLGLLHASMNNYTDAVQNHLKALDIKKDFWEAYKHLAYSYYNNKDLPNALNSIKIYIYQKKKLVDTSHEEEFMTMIEAELAKKLQETQKNTQKTSKKKG